MRPGAPPQSRRYVYTGPGEVSSLVTDPPGPRWPPARLEVLHLFRWYTHTHPYNTMRGHGAEAVLNQWKGSTCRGPQEAMLTSCTLAACRLYNAYVRKLFCEHLGSTCCRASRPRALEYTIVYGQSAKRDVIICLHAGLRGVIGTYHRWEGGNPLFTCGLEGRNRDVRGA